jgi:predicted  nucleic acid-binding Zn-ribbon protein
MVLLTEFGYRQISFSDLRNFHEMAEEQIYYLNEQKKFMLDEIKDLTSKNEELKAEIKKLKTKIIPLKSASNNYENEMTEKILNQIGLPKELLGRKED